MKICIKPVGNVKGGEYECMTPRKNLDGKAGRNYDKNDSCRTRLIIIIIALRLMTNGNVFIMMRDRRRRFIERMHIL